MQQPAGALEILRGKAWTFRRRLSAGVEALPKVTAMGNCYELKVRLHPSKGDVCGLNLCCGDGRMVKLSYDEASGILTADRTNSTPAELPKFRRMAFAEIGVNPELRIFVDKTTIEIFAADGLKVMTLLTYAAPGQDGVELFSLRGKTEVELTAWPLASTQFPQPH